MVLRRSTLLLMSFLTVLTVGLAVTVNAPVARADSYNQCDSAHNYAAYQGWVCFYDDVSHTQLSISQNSHYCINLSPWNDRATFAYNGLPGRIIRIYWDSNCGGESQQLNPGWIWDMGIHWTHEASSVYLYS